VFAPAVSPDFVNEAAVVLSLPPQPASPATIDKAARTVA
jgi:hypothetical protein